MRQDKTTHTATLHAWLPSYYQIEGFADSTPERICGSVTQIEAQIQKLLAISYDAQAVQA